jgi:hypothetical protein
VCRFWVVYKIVYKIVHTETLTYIDFYGFVHKKTVFLENTKLCVCMRVCMRARVRACAYVYILINRYILFTNREILH